MGCSRKNPHPPPRRMGFWKFSWEGGSKTLEIRAGGGLNQKKSSAGVISTDSSHDSNVQFCDTSALSDPENSRNILFSYFSPNMNDNLSFIAENTDKQILKNVSSQCCCNEDNETFETPDTFLLVPRPSAPPLCNFTQAPLKTRLHWTNLKAIFSWF